MNTQTAGAGPAAPAFAVTRFDWSVFPLVAGATAGLALLLLPALHAQTTLTWADAGSVFATGANWNGGTPPTNNLTTHIGSFAGATPVNPDLAAPQSIRGITFQSGAGSYTLASTSNSTLTLGASGIVSNANTLQTVSLPLQLGAAASLIAASAGNLAITGPVNNGGFTLTVGAFSSGTSSVSGVISGAGGLTLDGESSIVLTGANTFTGTVQILDGTLVVNTLANGGSASALGAGSSAIKLGGEGTTGTLVFSGTSATTNRAIDLAGILGGGATLVANNGTGALVFTSNFAATGAGETVLRLEGTGTGANAIQGAIVDPEGSTAVIKSGTGTWILSGNSTYSGGLTVNEGTLRVTTSTGALGTGPVTLNGGSLELANNTGLAFTSNTTSSGNTTVSNNVTLVSDTLSPQAGVNHTLGTLTIGASTLSLNAGGNVSSGTAGLTFGNTTLTGSPTFAIGSAASLTVGRISDGGSTLGLTKTGAGTLVLSGNTSTYTGRTIIAEGTVSVANLANRGTDSSLGAPSTVASATIDLGSGTAAATLLYTGSGDSTNRVLNLAGTTGGATIQNNGSGALTFSNALTATGAGAKTLTLAGSNTGNNTLSGAIPDSAGGATSLVKAGAGTWILSANNTYTGGTTVNQGTLKLGVSQGAVTTSPLTVNADSAGATATFALSGFNATFGSVTFGGTGGTSTSTSNITTGAGTLTLGGNVTFDATGNPLGSTLAGKLELGSATRTFTVGDSANAAADLTVSAVVSGTGGVSKAGAGTLVFSGVNTYSGDTTVNQGTLRLGAAPATTTSDLVMNANSAGATATFDLNGQNATFASVTFGGAGGTSTSTSNLATGAGTLTLGGSVTFSATGDPLGSTLSGKLELGSADRTFSINNSSNAAADLTVSAVISGTGGLRKSGAGTLVLSGVNTYTGDTTITRGTLQLGATQTVTSASLAIVPATGGTSLYDLNGFNATFASVTLGGAGGSTSSISNISSGTGTLTLGGNFTFDATGNPLGSTLSGNLALGSAARTFTIGDSSNAAADLTVSALISGGGSADLIKSGAGALVLSNPASTYTGQTVIDAGSISVAKLANRSSASSLGAPTSVANGTINLGSTTAAGTLIYTGSGDSTNRVLNLAGTTGGATLQNDGSGALTFTSALTATGAGSKTLTLAGTHTGDNTLAGAIVDNSGTHTTAVTKVDTGTWVLGGNNTFSGPITVSAGVLRATHASAFGDNSAGTTVASGAALQLQGGITVTGEALALSGTGISSDGALRNVSGNNTWTGALTLGAATRIQSDADTLTLSTGGITGATFGLTFSGAGNTTVSGVIATTSGTLTKSGSGTLTLASAANTYTGKTVISEGALSVNKLANLSSSSSLGAPTSAANGTIDIGSGANSGTLIYTGSGVTTNRVLNLAGTTGGATLRNDGSGAITFSSALTATGVGAKTLTFAGSGNGTLSGRVPDSSGGATALVKSGSGWWHLGGTNTFTGGVIVSGGNLYVDSGASLASANSLALTGGDLYLFNTAQTVASLSGTSGLLYLDSGHAFTLNQTGDTTFAGLIYSSNSSGSFTKSGSGALTLSGANIYSLATSVTAGTLFAHNIIGSATGTGSLNVSSGATLGGDGAIDGATTIDGTLAPGLGTTGLLTFNSSLNLGSGSNTLFEISGLTRGTGYDALNVTGALTLGGTLNVALVDGFSPTTGATFDLFNAGSVSGTFAALTLPSLGSGLTWDTSALAATGMISVVSAVPEPSTYALLAGLAALGIAVRRRRRRGNFRART